jgi:hypothetical protein
VVNSSLDDADGVRRALLPNCARNANHWLQQKKKADVQIFLNVYSR